MSISTTEMPGSSHESPPPPDCTADAPVRLAIEIDADVVAARRTVRNMASCAGFTATEMTLIATAVSEIARNIVCFARAGEMEMRVDLLAGRTGITIVARDRGPGIDDLAAALTDGVSTGGGLGLGLPGARRLMDEFHVASGAGAGTTVSMTKWRRS